MRPEPPPAVAPRGNAPAAVDRLLARIARRQGLAHLFRRGADAAVALAAALLVALAATRLWWHDAAAVLAHPATLGALAGVAFAYALLGTRWRDHLAAARAADAHARSEDLFLARTAASVSRVQPGLAPLLEREAEERAGTLTAAEVAPVALGRPLARAGVAAAAVAFGFLFLPFGTQDGSPTTPAPAVARAAARARERIETLTKKEVQAPHSPEVSVALAELQRAVQLPERQEVRAELRKVEPRLAELWQKAKREAPNTNRTRTGAGTPRDAGKQEAWRSELAAGKADALRRELQEIRDKAASGDREQTDEARERAREVRAFAQRTGATELAAAMADLLQQLGGDTPDAETLAALGERAELELEAARQAAADLAALESALRTEQLAEALAALDADLPQVDAAAALAEYEAAYGAKLAEELEGLEACEDCEGGG